MKIISIVGMTGVGKTTVGQELAHMLGIGFVDADERIALSSGSSPRELFDRYGEEHFRVLECQAIDDIIRQNVGGCVLSCGGGAVTYKPTAELLRLHTTVVWITRPVEDVARHPNVLARPPINGECKKYIELLERRRPLYSACANITIENIDPKDTAIKIIELLTAAGRPS